MKRLNLKWISLTCGVLLLLAFFYYLKTPTPGRAIAEKHGGYYVPLHSRKPDWQEILENWIGHCERLERPTSICIHSDNLTDDEVQQIGTSEMMDKICLEGSLLTDKVVYLMVNHKAMRYLTISSNQLTDDSFKAAAKIESLTDLVLVSDSITGEGITELSSTQITDLYLKSDNLDHSVISNSHFPKHLEELVLVGPPINLVDFSNYVSALPKGCKLRVSLPLPDISNVAGLARIDIAAAAWSPSQDGACNCVTVP